nr:HU family DNA-binding protein [Thermomonas alba]
MAFRVAYRKCRWYKVCNRGGWVGAAASPGPRQGSAAGSGQRILRVTFRNGANKHMNKAEFVEAIADHAELTKADAGRAVDAMIATITKALKKGDTVTLVGFGTFSVRKRGARTGRNPRTGDTIKIKASKNPAFKAGKALKDAVN